MQTVTPGAAREAVVVSACLLGVSCTHTGGHRLDPAVAALAARARLIPVCPEVAGGLPTPRPAAEVGVDGRVRTAAGEDLTGQYRRGAEHAVAVARAAGARRAVLKDRSPSCGSGQIYDGTHRRVLVEGDGVTVMALREAGVEVVSSEELGKGAAGPQGRPPASPGQGAPARGAAPRDRPRQRG